MSCEINELQKRNVSRVNCADNDSESQPALGLPRDNLSRDHIRQDARAATATEGRTERLRAAAIERRGTDSAEMAYIPSGRFTMGDTQGDGESDENPAHPTRLEAFWIDRMEVTNSQFARFIRASGYKPKKDWQMEAPEKGRHPAVNVTWHDAAAYCRWADKRLPTEAEWEYAARGTDNRMYPWGNSWEDTRARFGGNRGSQSTAPVGAYPTGASPFKVLDLAGNVWEWVSSLYRPYPYASTDGRENPTAQYLRVIRGGSWSNFPWFLRSTNRGRVDPSDRNDVLGFRCAQEP